MLAGDQVFIHKREGAGVWDCLYFGTPIPTLVKDGSGNSLPVNDMQ